MATHSAISGALVLAMVATAGCGGSGTHSSAVTGTTSQTTAARGAARTVHSQVQSLPAGDNPRDVVVAAGKIWVLDFNEPTLREFDTHGRQVRSVKLDSKSIAPASNSVWLGLLSNSNTGPQGPLAEVDAHSGQVARRLMTQNSVDLLAVGDGAVWTASRFDSRITRVPLSGGAQRTSPLPGTPTAIAISNGAVWVSFGHAGTAQAAGAPDTGTGGVAELDPATGAQITEQDEPAAPSALAVAHGTVWVALPNDVNELDRLSETTGQSITTSPTIDVGNTPSDLASGDGAVWALNYYDATITRVDATTGRVTDTFAFGPPPGSEALPANSPIRLAVTPGTLWVSDASANALRRLPDR